MALFNSAIGQFVLQSVLHSLLMALAVEALIKVWGVTRPRVRLQFRLLYLVLPLAGWPLYQLLWPERGSDVFRETVAIFNTQGWLPIHLGGLAGWEWVAIAMGIGTLLFVTRALLPTSQHYLMNPEAAEQSAPSTTSHSLVRDPGNPSEHLNLGTKVVDEPWALARITGVCNLRLTLSTSLLKLLDPEETKAVLAHEEAHALQRDNLLGWVLFGLGLLMFYNPVAMVALQRISQDVEMACDDAAGEDANQRWALASALMKVSRFNATERPSGFAPLGWLSNLGPRIDNALILRRVRRLTGGSLPPEVPMIKLRLGLTAVLSAMMLFFVV